MTSPSVLKYTGLSSPIHHQAFFNMAQRDERKSPPLADERSDKTNSESQYSPLASHSIRLIRILPGEPSAPVRCTVVQRHLEDHPEYDALSYAWGSNAKTHCIHVEPQDPSAPEMTLPVTRNYFRLLQHLRNTSISTGEIWIDAVCINQDNDREKEKQVAMMGEIVEGAKRVLVYPGDAHQDDLRRMADLRTYIKAENDDSGDAIATMDLKTYVRVLKNDGIQRPLDIITTMNDILQQQWFWRTWVLQEVIRASRGEIILGTDTSQWKKFSSVAIKIIPFGKKRSILRNNNFHETPPILRLTQSIGKGASLDLHDLLKRTKGLEASRNRDKIFALLGIASPDPRYESLVQYSTTLEEVYATFAKVFIARSNTLDVFSSSAEIWLRASTYRKTFGHSLSLPSYHFAGLKASWAPRWHVGAKDSDGDSIAASNHFNVAAGIPVSIVELPTNGKDGPSWNLLAVRGRRIGRVLFLPGYDRDDRLSFERLSGKSKDKVSSLCRNACAVVKGCSRYAEEPAEHICFSTFNFHLPLRQGSMQIEELSREFWQKVDDYQHLSEQFGQPEAEWESFYSNVVDRQICITDSGYFGLIPWYSEEGDLVCCLAGGSVPYVLRQSDDGDDFKLIGECYIHGVMQGEALRGAQLEDLEVFQLS